MSEKSLEAHVRDALVQYIRGMLIAEEQVRDDERRLRESKSRVESKRKAAEKHHAALLALDPSSTTPDFDKYVTNFKRANPS